MATKKVGCRIVLSASDVPATHERLANVIRRLSESWGVTPKQAKQALYDARGEEVFDDADQLDAVKLVSSPITSARGFRVAPVFVHAANAESILARRIQAATAEAARLAAKAADEPPAATVDVVPVRQASITARVSAIVDPLVVELQALRASVAELTRSMADLQAAVELRSETELSSTPCV